MLHVTNASFTGTLKVSEIIGSTKAKETAVDYESGWIPESNSQGFGTTKGYVLAGTN